MPDPHHHLIVRLRAGDPHALTETVQEFRTLLSGLLARFQGRCFTAEDRDETVNRAFLNCWRSIGSFRGDCSLKNYLALLARRLALNRIKQNINARRDRTDSLYAEHAPGATLENLLPDPRCFFESIEVQESNSVIDRALIGMKPSHREIIELRGRQNVSYDELAVHFGCNIGTVKSRLARARLQLRRALDAA